MPKTQCLCGTFLRTSVRSHSPYSTTRFWWHEGQKLVLEKSGMAALARKRQEIFVAAIVASNPGEAASQVSAIRIPVDRVRYIRSPESVSGGVKIVPNRLQFLEMVFHAVVEARFPGFARLVDPGDVFVRFRHGERPFCRNTRSRIKTKSVVPSVAPFYFM